MTPLLARAGNERDPAARAALLEEAERLMLADHPLLPVYFYVNKHLVKPEVEGWYDNVMNVVYSKDLALKDPGALKRPRRAPSGAGAGASSWPAASATCRCRTRRRCARADPRS